MLVRKERREGKPYFARDAKVQDGRARIPLLPAGEPQLFVFGVGWTGSATATALAEQPVTVRVPMLREPGRR